MTDRRRKSLTTEQSIVLNYLALPKQGGLTTQEIANIAGVHVRTIFKWKNNPLFSAELKKRIIKESSKYLPDLMNAMIDAVVEDHNAQAAKLILEMNDMLPTKGVSVEEKLKSKVDDKEIPTLHEMNDRITKYKGSNTS